MRKLITNTRIKALESQVEQSLNEQAVIKIEEWFKQHKRELEKQLHK